MCYISHKNYTGSIMCQVQYKILYIKNIIADDTKTIEFNIRINNAISLITLDTYHSLTGGLHMQTINLVIFNNVYQEKL